MKITLPGSETVTITGQTIDKLIRAGDGDAALLYLYILKTHGQKTSSEAAIALDKSKGWVASATVMLSKLGLIHLAENADVGVGAGAGVGADSSGLPPLEEPRTYTESEVVHEITNNADFSIVVDETQRKLGKILTPDDTMRLLGIYNNLRLPSEVIMQLITHCISESRLSGDGRIPNVRYIEKAAFTWEREGIFTFEKAEEYLKALEERKSARGRIKKALQIKGREFSPTEKKYVDDWITMGFEPEAIAIAYDINVMKKGNPTVPYIDGILKNWHNKDIHTAEQIKAMEKGQKKSSAGSGIKPGAQKHGEPNREEMERLERLKSKIKEE